MTESIPSVVDILGADGVIARRLQDYEPRPEQLEMALAVESALTKRHHLIAEAGTGVGKSFAYLIPAILAAQAERGPDSRKRRIIVSTHTISLQEQLIQHDIPFLQSVLPVEFSAVLVKGRNNYISLRRLDKAVQRSTQKSLFEPDGQQKSGSGRIRQLMALDLISPFSQNPMSGTKYSAITATVFVKSVPAITTVFITRPDAASGMLTC